MKAIVLTCFESNEERAGFVVETLKQLSFEVCGLTTNYSHIRKSFRNNFPKDFYSIKTKAYKKNLSLERMLSHKCFAKDAFKYIENYNPDLIWVSEPAHSLIYEANRYKKKHPNTKIIVDVIDMWPESLPIRDRIKESLPFKFWKNIRTKNINCADSLVTECDLYHDVLSDEYKKDIDTVYWSRDKMAISYHTNLDDSGVSLAYIGSINNIIDANIICKIVKNIDKKVIIHVIGTGENKDDFLNVLGSVCDVKYYGPIYDDDKKKEIFSKCHAGLNIYKENLYIGLTVKSIDYFNFGLPIINNIKGDTWNFVDKYNVGINVSNDYKINVDRLIDLRKNNQHILDLYNSNFTKDVFIKKCKKIVNKVLR